MYVLLLQSKGKLDIVSYKIFNFVLNRSMSLFSLEMGSVK